MSRVIEHIFFLRKRVIYDRYVLIIYFFAIKIIILQNKNVLR